MSYSVTIGVDFIPPPVKLGAMWSNDADGAWLIDATTNMQRRNTTIVSIGTAIVMRCDGTPIGSADLVVSAIEIQGAGLQWSFRATTNGNVTAYLIGFPLTLANGDQITRWFILPVVASLG